MARAKMAPVLRYLVETRDGFYTHPNVAGLHSGQEAWCDPRLWFQCHLDASEHARTLESANVIKMRIRAEREPIRRDNRASLNHVPVQGDIAMMQGWGTNACPHPLDSVARMRWFSDWWAANASAFESHIHGEDA